MIAFLIELPLFLLLTDKGKYNILVSGIFYLLLCTFILFYTKGKPHISLKIHYPVVSIILSIVSTAIFYMHWNTSHRLDNISEILRFPPKQIYLIIAFLLGLLSLTGIDYIIKIILTLLKKETVLSTKAKNLSDSAIGLYIFITGFLTISLNSQCSPLYAFNDWDDANTIFTVGKSILRGTIPYKDLYEQKGPLIFFLQVPGAAISFNSFVGIWLVEIIFAFFFLFLSYKTANLFFGQKVYILIPLLSFLTYGGYSFRTGNSAEEYCLPLIAYGIFVGCKAINENRLPSKIEFLFIGITSACVFWIKYSMVGFYLGWIFVFLISAFKNKIMPDILKGTILIFIGVCISSLPIFCYFAAHHALEHLFQCYFYNNLFLYPSTTVSFSDKLVKGQTNFVEMSPLSYLTVSFGLLWIVEQRNWKLLGFLGTTFMTLFITVYSNGWFHSYYSLIFNVFSIFGLIGFFDLIRNISMIKSKISLPKYEFTLSTGLIFVCMLMLCLNSHNMFYLRHEKEDLMQYKMKTMLENKGLKNPTIITWDYGETGVNTVMGIVPSVRFFCWYANDKIADLNNFRKKCLEDKCADVIMMNSKWEEVRPELENYQYEGYFEGTFNGSYRYYQYYMPSKE